MKIVAFSVLAVVTLCLVGCASSDNATAASTTTVTTTVTATVAATTVTAPPAPPGPPRTVDEAAAEGPTEWLLRLQNAGLGDWPVKVANDLAWQICDQLWVGGDYNLIIDKLSMNRPRSDVLAIYGVAVGYTCNQPPGAPPGYPK
ncbi:Uncharacterised protein [Mycobacteroides abscessus subsp. abscessus]|uniref:hypothetical protein n=1 Tax=Mycobacteroides abscessus TaxID=36809 RepID=UPI00092C9960|nr:hypothetical protein [Mycobacteroides abscessus]SHT46433.1 Uncharacterised protein [Mycobacteroides abscessus subsp. abscessus]SHW32724.1 Uncharacterised protein [Mycobacteroides abscessus subsp. abscessus]SIF91932.1 Uncharacterised protein [Mycobacteroides abscessus subsp. abscessus]SKD17764.1 Uncharacterised protein [Mycobacteroides abscessus subsp. abscessus]SKM22980.1 Uncharacterised protein [Mycobacteroides abscessus subsp. abscessus]